MNTRFNVLGHSLMLGLFFAATACVGTDGEDFSESEFDNVAEGSAAVIEEVQYNPNLALALPAIMDTRLGPSALPNGGWFTNAMIQNATNFRANIKLTATWKQGSANPGGSVTFSLGPRESINFRIDNTGDPGTIGIPAIANQNFEGSLVIDSDQRLAVVSNLSNLPLGAMGVSGGKAKGYYVGQSMRDAGWETGKDLIYPTFKSGFAGRSSTVFVQNVSPNNGSIVVTVRANDGNTYSVQKTLDAGRSVAIQPSELHRSNGASMPSNCSGPSASSACFGSVSIQSNAANVRLAAMTSEYPSSSSVPLTNIVANTFRSAAFMPKVQYCPQVSNGFAGVKSGISIMNTDSSSANIQAVIQGVLTPANPASGRTYVEEFLGVPAKSSVAVTPWQDTMGGFPDGGRGVARIVADRGIFAVTSENDGTVVSGHQCSSNPQSQLLAPLVKVAFPSATGTNGANTELSVQNIGTVDTTITGEFRCRAAGSSVLETYYIAKSAEAGGAALFSRGNVAVPDGRLCSVVFTSPSPIMIGTATETTRGLAIPQLDDATYELF